MNEFTEIIEKYLSGEMSNEEKADFEKQLQNNAELLAEFMLQRQAMQGVIRSGVRSQVESGLKTAVLKSKFVKWGIAILVVVTVVTIALIIKDHRAAKMKEAVAQMDSVPFINRPLKNVDIPFKEYSFNAEEGDTLFYKSGSIILFPPNALVDANGNLIKGNVKVVYREFSDPVDYFISGIPMQYDSAGVNYTFESSGMCEIKAYQNNEPVFVNPKNKPQINMATNSADPNANLYILDTVAKQWVSKGKDVITDMSQPQQSAAPAAKAKSDSVKYDAFDEPSVANVPAPVKPLKADGKRPTFSVEIDKTALPELQVYNNLNFEIDESDKSYNPKDADIQWEDVKVTKGTKAGTYIVAFAKGSKKVSYITRPVFEGKDYDEAMRVFEQKSKEYQKLVTQRQHGEQQQQQKTEKEQAAFNEKNAAIQKENERIEKLNVLIDARNKITEAENAKTIAANKEVEAKKRIYDLAMMIVNKKPITGQYSQVEIAKAQKMVKDELDKQKAVSDSLIAKMKKQIDSINKQQQLAFKKQQDEYKKDQFESGGMKMYGTLFQTFTVDGFGIWNSDNPTMLSKRGSIELKASFVNENNKHLEFIMVQNMFKGFKGICADHDPDADYNFPAFNVVPNTDNLIWAVRDNKLYYFTADDYNKAGITKTTKDFTFKMRTYPGEIKTADDLRNVLKLDN